MLHQQKAKWLKLSYEDVENLGRRNTKNILHSLNFVNPTKKKNEIRKPPWHILNHLPQRLTIIILPLLLSFEKIF